MTLDLFNEKRIIIPDNPTLARVATHVISLVERDKTLIDGNDRGLIDKKIVLAVWESDGLNGTNYREFLLSDKMTSADTITRAVRYLVSEDYLRLSAGAVRDGNNQAARLAKAFHKK
jgi:hypothetical protein